ncbi:hypothetical protein CROQUDRAFT_660786, partial [Cronartium quercuum f. sp. fusiforme G11]
MMCIGFKGRLRFLGSLFTVSITFLCWHSSSLVGWKKVDQRLNWNSEAGWRCVQGPVKGVWVVGIVYGYGLQEDH